MSGLDADGGIGCSANNVRWACLIDVAELLSEGKIVLEPFANGVEKPRNAPSNSLGLGITNKGKRSPRTKKVLFVQSESLEAAGINGDNKHLKINRNLRKTHDVITIKNPSSKNTRKRRMNCKEKEGVSKKRAKKTSDVMDPAPDLPQAFKNCILNRGCDPESVVLVTQKQLTGTDVDAEQYKLSVRYSEVRNKFLKPSEVGELDKKKGRVKAILLQPCLEECKISLGERKSNSEYALVDGWNEVCSRNGLKKGMKIQLWSFRRNTELCFALVQLS